MSMPTCDTCSHVRLLCEKAGVVSQTSGCSFHEYKGSHYKLSDDEVNMLKKLLEIGAAAYGDSNLDNNSYRESMRTVFNNLSYKLSEQYGFDPVYF